VSEVARELARITRGPEVWPQRGWEYLRRLGFTLRHPRPKHIKADNKAQEAFKEELPDVLQRVKQENPNAVVELWTTDEHRIGLQPVMKKVWAAKGSRPVAKVHRRFQWLYLYAFLRPQSGDTFWLILPSVSSELMTIALKEFADYLNLGPNRQVLLVLDQSGWHVAKDVEVPQGIHLHSLPPYSPELQPAERLWSLTDECIANQAPKDLTELEDKLEDRCNKLTDMRDDIRRLTLYSWWPKAG